VKLNSVELTLIGSEILPGWHRGVAARD